MQSNYMVHRLLAITILISSILNTSCNEVGSKSSLRRLEERQLQKNSIIKLELINAETDKKIMDLVNGQVINIMNTGLTQPSFSINATASSDVKSVRFGYNATKNFRTEGGIPFALCGNAGTNFYPCPQLGYGTHTVTATPTSISGIVGTTVSVTFTIVSGSPVAPPVPVPAPIRAPVAAPIQTAAPLAVLPAIHTLRLMYTGVDPSVSVMILAFDKINVVDLNLLKVPSGKFNIDALVGPGVQSVTFSNNRTETSAPLAYCGNNGNAFYDCEDLVLGATVTVTVTAYPERSGAGTPILSRSATIQIIRTVAPTPPTAAPVAAPTRPPVPGCPLPKVC
jgi:hypothetical protein